MNRVGWEKVSDLLDSFLFFFNYSSQVRATDVKLSCSHDLFRNFIWRSANRNTSRYLTTRPLAPYIHPESISIETNSDNSISGMEIPSKELTKETPHNIWMASMRNATRSIYDVM